MKVWFYRVQFVQLWRKDNQKSYSAATEAVILMVQNMETTEVVVAEEAPKKSDRITEQVIGLQ